MANAVRGAARGPPPAIPQKLCPPLITNHRAIGGNLLPDALEQARRRRAAGELVPDPPALLVLLHQSDPLERREVPGHGRKGQSRKRLQLSNAHRPTAHGGQESQPHRVSESLVAAHSGGQPEGHHFVTARNIKLFSSPVKPAVPSRCGGRTACHASCPASPRAADARANKGEGTRRRLAVSRPKLDSVSGRGRAGVRRGQPGTALPGRWSAAAQRAPRQSPPPDRCRPRWRGC